MAERTDLERRLDRLGGWVQPAGSIVDDVMQRVEKLPAPRRSMFSSPPGAVWMLIVLVLVILLVAFVLINP